MTMPKVDLDFVDEVEAGEVDDVYIDEDNLTPEFWENIDRYMKTLKPIEEDPHFVEPETLV